jgi:hypothetical protein
MQFEFPWALGPSDGRYLLRDGEDGDPERVIVVQTLAAPYTPRQPAAGGRGSLRGLLTSRGETEASTEPAPVTTTRITIIDPISLSAELQARAWLDGLDREHEVDAAVAIVNRVIYMHRIATADPHVHEVAPSQALVIRAGWGEGEQVAGGAWMHARELPITATRKRLMRVPRPGASRARSRALRPQERLAALLGARSRALVCEELALRTRQDLDHGRLRLAALELDEALIAAAAELRAEGREDLALRIAELEALHEGIAAQAARGRAAGAGGDAQDDGAGGRELDVEVLEHALGRLEAALRARSAVGFHSR